MIMSAGCREERRVAVFFLDAGAHSRFFNDVLPVEFESGLWYNLTIKIE